MYMSNVHCTLHKRTFQMLVPSYGHGHGHGLVWHAGLQLPSLPSLVPSDRHCTLPPPHTAPFLPPILHPSSSLYCTPPPPFTAPLQVLYCTLPPPYTAPLLPPSVCYTAALHALLHGSYPSVTACFLPPGTIFLRQKRPKRAPKLWKIQKKSYHINFQTKIHHIRPIFMLGGGSL